jgi:hypothetical protein
VLRFNTTLNKRSALQQYLSTCTSLPTQLLGDCAPVMLWRQLVAGVTGDNRALALGELAGAQRAAVRVEVSAMEEELESLERSATDSSGAEKTKTGSGAGLMERLIAKTAGGRRQRDGEAVSAKALALRGRLAAGKAAALVVQRELAAAGVALADSDAFAQTVGFTEGAVRVVFTEEEDEALGSAKFAPPATWRLAGGKERAASKKGRKKGALGKYTLAQFVELTARATGQASSVQGVVDAMCEADFRDFLCDFCGVDGAALPQGALRYEKHKLLDNLGKFKQSMDDVMVLSFSGGSLGLVFHAFCLSMNSVHAGTLFGGKR